MELQTNVKSGEVKITSPETTTTVVKETTEKKSEPDLITRVSQFKKDETTTEATTKTTTEKEVKEPEFDFKDIEAIQDPAAKEQALKAYKSFQKGFNQKFQDLADLRKTYEQKVTETSNWTPERIQGLLNDSNFVNAAKSVMASQAPQAYGGTQEDWSALSETDKAKFQQLENKIISMEQQNYQVRKLQEDEALKNRYSNYNAQAMDILTADLLQQKVIATREHLWKVYDYEGAVERAYNLGLQDGTKGVKEKVSSSSMEGTMATSTKEPLKKEEGETDRTYFRRLFLDNVSRQKETSIKK